MLNALNLFLALAAILVLVGCGQADSVRAKQELVVPVALKAFPAEDWRLVNNKFFLWGENLTAEEVSRVKAIADRIDELDSLAVPLNRKRFALESQIEPLESDIELLEDQHYSLDELVQNTRTSLGEAETNLSGLKKDLDEERSKPQPAEDVIRSLESKLAAAQAVVTTLQSQLEQEQAVEEEMREKIVELQEELEPIQEELDAVNEKQFPIEIEGQAKVEEITQLVHWYKDQPSSVAFKFQEDGSISASIEGWNLGDNQGQRRFSTRKGVNDKVTMGNVSYEPLGGVFEFEAYVYEDPAKNERLRETYAFKISRSKYNAEDGRKFFTGEITRTRLTANGTEVRRGIAKLVDRNN